MLCGSALLAQAQRVPSTSVVSSTADLLNQGQMKAKQGDYQGAIAAYTQALQATPKTPRHILVVAWLTMIWETSSGQRQTSSKRYSLNHGTLKPFTTGAKFVLI